MSIVIIARSAEDPRNNSKGGSIKVRGIVRKQIKATSSSLEVKVISNNKTKSEAIDEIEILTKKIINKSKEYGFLEKDIQIDDLQDAYGNNLYIGKDITFTLVGDVSKMNNFYTFIFKNFDNKKYHTFPPEYYFSITDNSLTVEALKNAEAKAKKLAQENNKKLGGVLYIDEGIDSYANSLDKCPSDYSSDNNSKKIKTICKAVTVQYELLNNK